MDNGRFSVAVVLMGVSVLLATGIVTMGQLFSAKAQEPKRFQYKIVDVLSDTQSMQAALNQHGSEGWELVAVGMGDLTAPRLIFKK
jgi:hypothetical protein